MATQEIAKQKSLSNMLNDLLTNEATSKMIKDALGDDRNKGKFIANIIELTNTDAALAKCQAKDIMMEAFKALSVGVTLSKTFGQGYVIAYAGKPQFQIGYHGLYQIARKTHTITTINVETIFKGQVVKKNYLTGEISITGEPDGTKEVIGYSVYLEEKDGFHKADYWDLDKMVNHAIAYSKSLNTTAEKLKNLAIEQTRTGKIGGKIGWEGNFDAMAHKTILKHHLLHWALMDIFSDLPAALEADTVPDRDTEVAANAGQTSVTEDVPYEEVNTSTGEVQTEQPKEQPKAEQANYGF